MNEYEIKIEIFETSESQEVVLEAEDIGKAYEMARDFYDGEVEVVSIARVKKS